MDILKKLEKGNLKIKDTDINIFNGRIKGRLKDQANIPAVTKGDKYGTPQKLDR